MYFNFMDIMNQYKNNITLGNIANLINEGEIQNLLDIEWTVLLDKSNIWYYQGTIDVIKKIIKQIVGDSVKVATIESLQKNLKRHGLHWCNKTDLQRIITVLDNMKEDINDYEYYDLQAVKRRAKTLNKTGALPIELNTPCFEEILKKAIQSGFVEETAEGWKWIGKKNELAWFICRVSAILNLSKAEGDNGKFVNWQPFFVLFHITEKKHQSGLVSALSAINNKKNEPPKRKKDIEQLFK